MLIKWFIFTSLLTLCDAEVWISENEEFTAHPLPKSSSYEYARYLAHCSKKFHNLVDNCDKDGENCPVLSDSKFQKLLDVYPASIDPIFQNAKGPSIDFDPFHSDFDVNTLQESDFYKSTDIAWNCKRINYRHLIYYEMATSGALEKYWAVDSATLSGVGPFAKSFLNPSLVTPATAAAYDAFFNTLNAQPIHNSASVIKVVSALKHFYTQPELGTISSSLPYSKFHFQYDFAKNLQLASKAQWLLSDDYLINRLKQQWGKTGFARRIQKVHKKQVKEFLRALTQKWKQTSGVNQRYYYFSEKYFELTRLNPSIESTLGTTSLKYGQLADLFYLNYFFGLPN
uniref:Peptidase_M13_N domain-containing protein n=1 Tax=Panagrellus redivivus TaxID=6233 RepID=A0A7E4UQW8_PANRE